MIVRAARFFSREVESLHAAAYILGVSALASSVLALLRDRLFADYFGAGLELDIYFAAFRIPDLLFVLVASLFSAYALIPMLEKRDEAGQFSYIDTIVFGFGALMVTISVVACVFLPQMLTLLFPDLMAKGAHELVLMSRILLLQPFFLGLSNILAAITQIRRKYFLYALAPIVYNISIIGGLLFFYTFFGTQGLAWGVVVGSILHALVQFPSALYGGFFRNSMRFGGWETLSKTIALSLPRTLALGVGQIVQVSLLAFAGALVPGSIAVFMLAFNLQSVPLAVIGASYSVAAFPTLSRMYSGGNFTQFIEQVAIAARHILFWAMPSVALLIILRAHVVRAVLGSGAFDWTDTRLTAAAFALFAFSLAAQALSLLLIRAYYAAGRSYLPLIVSIGSGALATGLAFFSVNSYTNSAGRFFLEALLRVEDVPGTVVLLLPFAYAVGSIASAISFVVLFERDFGGFISRVSRVFWESLTASGAGAALAYAVLSLLGGIGPAATLPAVLTHGAFAGLVGIAGSAIVYWFFGSIELSETLATLKRRPHTVAPVQSAEETIT